MHTERLLGYDVRLAPEHLQPATWLTPDIRDSYILNREADVVLSADRSHWPSTISDLQTERIWTGPSYPLWEDLGKMLAYAGSVDQTSNWLIAATVVIPNNIEPTDIDIYGYEFGDTIGRPTPTTIPGFAPCMPIGLYVLKQSVPVEAQLLGYDVADWALLSLLSNCGGNFEEKEMLRSRYSQSINSFNLVTNAKDADLLAEVLGDLVPEHSPGYGIGLYHIPWDPGKIGNFESSGPYGRFGDYICLNIRTNLRRINLYPVIFALAPGSHGLQSRGTCE